MVGWKDERLCLVGLFMQGGGIVSFDCEANSNFGRCFCYALGESACVGDCIIVA